MPFNISQCAYQEDQVMQPGESGSGVYFVRKGEFSYYKHSKKEGKTLEALRFTKGHIFGTLELGSLQCKRVFTVKCKSHEAIVFNFSE